MSAVKIVCLGAGSFYFPRPLGDLAISEDLHGSEITLYDLDATKAAMMAGLGQRLAEEAGADFTIRCTESLDDAIDGADFAISSIGGSGAEVTRDVYHSYYHAADSWIAGQYGIYQPVGDTGGPCGMMMGLRSIPAYLEICAAMEKRCPGVVLLSHSNPMAILCRAMNKYSGIKVIGICHGVQGTIRQVGQMLELPAAELKCTWVGTNHYYWVLRVEHGGEDVTDRLTAAFEELGVRGSDDITHRLSRIYGYKLGYPQAGHLTDFYGWLAHADSLAEMPYDLAADARRHGFPEAMPEKHEPSAALRTEFYANYQKELDKVELPARGAVDHVSEEGVARMIGAMISGRREEFIVNVANAGTVSNLPDTALVEVAAVTRGRDLEADSVGECPIAAKGILEKRFAWHELVVDAARTGDRNTALQALMLDETAIHPDKAEDMLEDLLNASRDLLPQFFGA